MRGYLFDDVGLKKRSPTYTRNHANGRLVLRHEAQQIQATTKCEVIYLMMLGLKSAAQPCMFNLTGHLY